MYPCEQLNGCGQLGCLNLSLWFVWPLGDCEYNNGATYYFIHGAVIHLMKGYI